MGFGQIGCGWAVDMGRGVRVLELLLAALDCAVDQSCRYVVQTPSRFPVPACLPMSLPHCARPPPPPACVPAACMQACVCPCLSVGPLSVCDSVCVGRFHQHEGLGEASNQHITQFVRNSPNTLRRHLKSSADNRIC